MKSEIDFHLSIMCLMLNAIFYLNIRNVQYIPLTLILMKLYVFQII